MRLSVLLQREPFGTVLERTLASYWSRQTGAPVEVRWGQADRSRQVWRGNIYLNFFATDDTDASCFEVLVREFGHARSVWKRPVQKAYVHAAVGRTTRRWLSQVSFDASPAVPRATGQVLVGGNRRLRLILPEAGRSIVLHKHGFDPRGLHREIEARRGAAGSVAPTLQAVGPDWLSLEEEYIVGTPINRMDGIAESVAREKAIILLAKQVHRPTERLATLADLVGAAVATIRSCVAGASTTRGAGMPAALDAVLSRIGAEAVRTAGSAAFAEVLSHGDFQEANVLRVGSKLLIIDWENATRRSAAYDILTMRSGLRLSHDWVLAWEKTCAGWGGTARPALELGLGGDWTPALRSGLALLWALEEAAFRAEDVVLSPFADRVSAWSRLADDLERVAAAWNRITA